MAISVGIGTHLSTFRNYHTSTLLPIARYSAKGRTNQDANRTILPDLTGNGHDITLKNFSYSGMSGFGGYTESYANYTPNEITLAFRSNNKLIFDKIPSGSPALFFLNGDNSLRPVPTYKIHITGLTEGVLELEYAYVVDVGGTLTRAILPLNKDGTYILPSSLALTEESKFRAWQGFYRKQPASSCNIVIEMVPEYPEGLVFDGVNDFGVNLDFSVGNDYTVIIQREWFDRPSSAIAAEVLLAKRTDVSGVGVYWGEFTMEKRTTNQITALSYGGSTAIVSSIFNKDKAIIVQSKHRYQNIALKPGTSQPTNVLTLGAGSPGSEYWNGVFYDLIIYDKTLTEEEINSEIEKYGLSGPVTYLMSEDGNYIYTEDSKLIQIEE